MRKDFKVFLMVFLFLGLMIGSAYVAYAVYSCPDNPNPLWDCCANSECGANQSCSNHDCVCNTGFWMNSCGSCCPSTQDCCCDEDCGSPSEYYCKNGACMKKSVPPPSCTDDCSAGSTRCSGSALQSCRNCDGDSCNEWCTDNACNSRHCSGSDVVQDYGCRITDKFGSTVAPFCDSLAVYSCSRSELGGCNNGACVNGTGTEYSGDCSGDKPGAAGCYCGGDTRCAVCKVCDSAHCGWDHFVSPFNNQTLYPRWTMYCDCVDFAQYHCNLSSPPSPPPPPSSPPASSCGNGACEASNGETCSSCASDCSCGADKVCSGGRCMTTVTCPTYGGSVKKSDFKTLRSWINIAQSEAGITQSNWTDLDLLGLPVKTTHLEEMCSAVKSIKTTLGVTSTATCYSTGLAGLPIKAIQIQGVCNLLHDVTSAN